MGNSNEPIARYISEEELHRITELELKQKLKKQIRAIKIIDDKLYDIAWNISLYKNGGYGKDLYYFPNARRFGKYTSLTIIFLVRALYFWYSNMCNK